MKNKTIAALKVLFEAGAMSKNSIEKLKKDKRKGVQQLIVTYENIKYKEELLEQNFTEMSYFEQKSYALGYKNIAGIDEAGRGPLAGPVVAAAVILPREFKLLGLTDSKQLNELTRNKFFKIIVEQAISYGVSIVSSEEIDRINIYEATKLAMCNALNKLKPIPNHVLIDAVNLKNLPFTSDVIIKGDQKSITIAAASVLAKVTRDQLMQKIHTKYPVYNFTSNKGYGTKHHLEMLTEHGASPYHRVSYAPVRDVMNQ